MCWHTLGQVVATTRALAVVGHRLYDSNGIQVIVTNPTPPATLLLTHTPAARMMCTFVCLSNRVDFHRGDDAAWCLVQFTYADHAPLPPYTKQARRAIQLGLRGSWQDDLASGAAVLNIQDISDFVRVARPRTREDLDELVVPVERVYVWTQVASRHC